MLKRSDLMYLFVDYGYFGWISVIKNHRLAPTPEILREKMFPIWWKRIKTLQTYACLYVFFRLSKLTYLLSAIRGIKYIMFTYLIYQSIFLFSRVVGIHFLPIKYLFCIVMFLFYQIMYLFCSILYLFVKKLTILHYEVPV